MRKKYDWENYLIIEKDFIEAKKYISFERTANLETDSPFLQNEIVLLGSKVELAMKQLISYRNPDKSFRPGNISEYKRLLLAMFPDLEGYETLMLHTDSKFMPFKDWTGGKLQWWEAYSKIKHGSSKLPKLEYALNLLSAYQILLFLIQFYEQQESEYLFYALDETPQLLDFCFKRDLHPFDTFGFGFPREQINECQDIEIIRLEIEKIKEEKKTKK